MPLCLALCRKFEIFLTLKSTGFNRRKLIRHQRVPYFSVSVTTYADFLATAKPARSDQPILPIQPNPDQCHQQLPFQPAHLENIRVRNMFNANSLFNHETCKDYLYTVYLYSLHYILLQISYSHIPGVNI